MAKTLRLALIALLSCFSAIALRQSSNADQAVYGSWAGVESYTEEDFLNGQIVGYEAHTNYHSSLSFGYIPGLGAGIFLEYASISGGFVGTIGPQDTDLTFMNGPNTGNFFASYDFILPNGEIDPINSSAVADISIIAIDGNGTGDIFFDSFYSGTVPEPASIVQAALAAMIIACFAWMRGARFRPQSRPS
jgi:hypothetical protein